VRPPLALKKGPSVLPLTCASIAHASPASMRFPLFSSCAEHKKCSTTTGTSARAASPSHALRSARFFFQKNAPLSPPACANTLVSFSRPFSLSLPPPSFLQPCHGTGQSESLQALPNPHLPAYRTTAEPGVSFFFSFFLSLFFSSIPGYSLRHMR